MGGELEDLKSNLKESFVKIREDINRLNEEILTLKKDYKLLLEENVALRQSASPELVRQIVAETLKEAGKTSKNRVEQHYLRKINRNRKLLLKNRILELANMKNQSLPEMKETIVDVEQLCSKATFYRYVERMKEKGMIDSVKIGLREVLANIKGSFN